MNKNLSVSRRHPIVFGIIVMVVFFFVMNVAGALLIKFGPAFLYTNGDWVMQGSCECITALAAIAMAAIFKVWKIWGERGNGFGKGLLASMYFIVGGLYSLIVSLVLLMNDSESPGIEVPWKIAVFVATVFLIGFTEETFFRGIIANLFYDKHATDKAGVWTAVIGSGFVFGLMHLGNCISAIQASSSGGYYVDMSVVVGSMVQAAAACMMGMALTAIYYRCRNIWVLAFVHGFNDLCGAFTAGVTKGGSLIGEIFTYTPFMFVSMIPYVILVIFLLRPKKMAEILAYRHSHMPKHEDELSELSANQPEQLSYADEAGSIGIIGDTACPEQKSKRSMMIAVCTATAIMVALFALSVSLYMGGSTVDASNGVFSYSSTENWDGAEPEFSRSFGSFEAPETRDYKFTLTSYPGDSNAYVTFTVKDSSGKTVYSDVYGGRCSLDFYLRLNGGESYEITAIYDFSEVAESMNYVTRITVE